MTTDPTPPPAASPRRGRQPGPLSRGIYPAPECAEDRALRQDGTLSAHNRKTRQGYSIGPCRGVGHSPNEQLPPLTTPRPPWREPIPKPVRHVVNWPRLIESVEIACEIRGCSLRNVGAAIGIAPSGLTRMRQGHALAADALASLVAWLYPASIPTWIKEHPRG